MDMLERKSDPNTVRAEPPALGPITGCTASKDGSWSYVKTSCEVKVVWLFVTDNTTELAELVADAGETQAILSVASKDARATCVPK